MCEVKTRIKTILSEIKEINKLGYEVSYGAVFAAIIGYSTSVIISLVALHKKYGFKFTDTRKKYTSAYCEHSYYMGNKHGNYFLIKSILKQSIASIKSL
mgnify:CR=1 FL=1